MIETSKDSSTADEFKKFRDIQLSRTGVKIE